MRVQFVLINHLIKLPRLLLLSMDVVVVYHVLIVAIGHGLFKKIWPLVLGCVLRTAGNSIMDRL